MKTFQGFPIKMHKDLTFERWCSFSLMMQMANVGTEVERIIYWRNKGDAPQSNAAFDRAWELITLTILDPKNKKRLKELCRVRVCLIDYFIYDNEHGSSDKLWQDYFYAFNYAAALERGR